jgi:hydrogenase nickel incorporation protein HypA/HybF
MHELSIALSIVDGVTEEAGQHGGGPVRAVHLRLGRLSGIVAEALLFSYEVACEGTALQGSELRIEEVEGNEMLIVAMELDS